MMDNVIKLEEQDTLKLRIIGGDGKPTGEYLEFDLEDIELPLIYQDVLEQTKKNKDRLKNQFLIIEKRQDVKGKKFLTKNQEDKIKALNEFFKKQVEIYNMILGENGVSKLLNGRKIGWTSLQTIDDIVSKQIGPYLDVDMKRITNKVKEKYNITEDKEVLK